MKDDEASRDARQGNATFSLLVLCAWSVWSAVPAQYFLNNFNSFYRVDLAFCGANESHMAYGVDSLGPGKLCGAGFLEDGGRRQVVHPIPDQTRPDVNLSQACLERIGRSLNPARFSVLPLRSSQKNGRNNKLGSEIVESQGRKRVSQKWGGGPRRKEKTPASW